MSYASAPFWWLTCDARLAASRTLRTTTTMRHRDQAQSSAVDSDWIASADDRLHYCPDHRRYVCIECEKSEGREYPLNHEGMCDECWAEDAETGHGRS